MFSTIASIVVVCLGVSYSGWEGDGIAPIQDNNVAPLNPLWLGRIVDHVKAFMAMALGGNNDACCCDRGRSGGGSLSQCPKIESGVPRSWLYTWIVGDAERRVQLTTSPSKGHSIVRTLWFGGVSMLVILFIILLIRVWMKSDSASEKAVESMRQTIAEQERKLSQFWHQEKSNRKIIEALKKMTEKYDGDIKEKLLQKYMVWRWYDKIKERCKEQHRLLIQRDLEKEELAKTVEYLVRRNERQSREDSPGHSEACESSLDLYWEDDF